MKISEGERGNFLKEVAAEGEEGASVRINRMSGICHNAKAPATAISSSAFTCVGSVESWLPPGFVGSMICMLVPGQPGGRVLVI